jgi:hypothetical protein
MSKAPLKHSQSIPLKANRASKPNFKKAQSGGGAGDEDALMRNLEQKQQSALCLSYELGVWFGDVRTQPPSARATAVH